IIKGPLDGIPITYKDNFCTKELPTTCGSKMLENFISPFNATVVDLLQDAGVVMIGKTIVGGNSGGSAAVASGMCFASLGSDTGGSIRLPASYCGVIGSKPSYGQCSRWGLIAYASSLDTIGIITRNVLNAQLMMVRIISKYDEKDPSSLPSKLRSINASLASFDKTNSTNLSELRIGTSQEYYVTELSDPIKNLCQQGISLLRSHAEASSNLVQYDGVRYGHRSNMDFTQDELLYAHTRNEGFGEEVKRHILLGTYTLTAG
ncbi:4879_t:CDS:2, partial [Cetraspora pellucida]